jgi:hypothetical protein
MYTNNELDATAMDEFGCKPFKMGKTKGRSHREIENSTTPEISKSRPLTSIYLSFVPKYLPSRSDGQEATHSSQGRPGGASVNEHID